MATKTKIEWTDVAWNPVRGCSLVSAGCANCYAMKQAHRFSGPGQPYDGLTMIGQRGPSWVGTVRTVPDLLDAPLHWRKPCRVFVNSMSDLFHEDVPDEFIAKVFLMMAITPKHTYQILTKRPNRMLEWARDESCRALVIEAEGDADWVATKWPGSWPLPNVWLGVSVENQATADERIPLLLETPAAVRFVSAEPLLGPIDLTRIDGASLDPEAKGIHLDALTGGCKTETPWHLNWVIVGGESGPDARPCDVAWIRSIRDQCKGAGVPVLVKQLGSRPMQRVGDEPGMDGMYHLSLRDKKGGDMAEWPEDLRVREWPR